MCDGISLNLHNESACCFIISTQPWLHLSRNSCRVEAFNCYSSLVSIEKHLELCTVIGQNKMVMK